MKKKNTKSMKQFTIFKDLLIVLGKNGKYGVRDKWGIIEVVDGDLETDIKYDYEYPLTKRRILVPCEYNSIEAADAQLGASHEWKDPLFNVDSPQY